MPENDSDDLPTDRGQEALNRKHYREVYLKSEHWLDVKKRYRESKLPQACWCGETKVDLHHRTYKRIGAEHLGDLVPLCRRHHDEVHAGKRARRSEKIRARHLPSPAEVEAAKSGRGAWTMKQLSEWGVRWPPPKGWRSRLRREYEKHHLRA